jgi:methylated-DNA-protein-cysteine methyltransferase-like protein
MEGQKKKRRSASPHVVRYEDIWEIVRLIPRGRVSTYGDIARLAGLLRRARFVGYALHSLPQGLPVPWHRVINARGRISFPEGSPNYKRQKALLVREGIMFIDGKVDLKKRRWKKNLTADV